LQPRELLQIPGVHTYYTRGSYEATGCFGESVGAYIPSIRLQIWLASATVGVGVDRISDGSLAFIAKFPMSVVKALQHGVAVDLLGVVVKVGRRSVPLV